jgi:hypothetical protein
MRLLPSLLSDLKAVCAACPNLRKGRGGNIASADFGLSAVAMFFFAERVVTGLSANYGKRPSAAPIVRGYSASARFPPTITSATSAIFSTRRTPRPCSPCFERMEALLSKPVDAAGLGRLGGRTLVAWDGTEFFCSQKLGCPRCDSQALQARPRAIILCCRRRSWRPAIPRSCR